MDPNLISGVISAVIAAAVAWFMKRQQPANPANPTPTPTPSPTPSDRPILDAILLALQKLLAAQESGLPPMASTVPPQPFSVDIGSHILRSDSNGVTVIPKPPG